MTLPELCQSAGITATSYWQKLWFDGCRLDRNILLCPDRATAERVDRLFLPQLQQAMADVEIRVEGMVAVQDWARAQEGADSFGATLVEGEEQRVALVRQLNKLRQGKE